MQYCRATETQKPILSLTRITREVRRDLAARRRHTALTAQPHAGVPPSYFTDRSVDPDPDATLFVNRGQGRVLKAEVGGRVLDVQNSVAPRGAEEFPEGGALSSPARLIAPRAVYNAPAPPPHALTALLQPELLASRHASPLRRPRHTRHPVAMAAKYFVLFAACFALTQAALVRRDAPAQPDVLQEIQKHAAEFSKTFGEQFNSFVNSPNTQEFNKALKEGSDSLVQQISALSSSLQSAVGDANGKAKDALEQMRQNLERTTEELRRAHPDVERQATELRDKLQAAVQTTVQESQNLAKEVAANMEQTNQKLAPKLKEAYDDFVKQAQQVQQKLHEAATKQ